MGVRFLAGTLSGLSNPNFYCVAVIDCLFLFCGYLFYCILSIGFTSESIFLRCVSLFDVCGGIRHVCFVRIYVFIYFWIGDAVGYRAFWLESLYKYICLSRGDG